MHSRSFGGKTTKAYCSLWTGVVGFCSCSFFSLLTGDIASAMKWQQLRELPPFPLAFLPSSSLNNWHIWSYSSPQRGWWFLMLASTWHGLWPSFDLKIFKIKLLTYLKSVSFWKTQQNSQKSAKLTKSCQRSPKVAKIHQNSPSASLLKNPRLLVPNSPRGRGLGG